MLVIGVAESSCTQVARKHNASTLEDVDGSVPVEASVMTRAAKDLSY